MTGWNAAAYHKVSGPQTAWGQKVLARLELRGDERAIDAGCGSGRLTGELMERLPQGLVEQHVFGATLGLATVQIAWLLIGWLAAFWAGKDLQARFMQRRAPRRAE